MTASASSVGPRYAPPDPNLPKPWRGLVDGKTGNLYYWNPETNVTQYQRPEGAAPSQKSSSELESSSTQKSSQGQHPDNGDSDRYGKGSNADSSKLSTGVNDQLEGKKPHHSQDASNVPEAGHGPAASKSFTSISAGSDLSPDDYRRRHEISVSGTNVPPPFTSFSAIFYQGNKVPPPFVSLNATGFPAELFREIHQAGFSAPTPIQAQSWPIALQGRDIVAIAKTGSGKTLGYLIPSFMHLKKRNNNPRMGPTVLVLSPTRELATQIQDEAVKFGRSSRISCTCLYGGAPKGPQLKDLDRGVDIVVATPGRLNDILEMKRVTLHQISYLVLDEADRMLDMGFEPQIRKIVKEVPSQRQTLMYTATWPKEVRKIAADLLTNPVQVNIGNVDELVANKSITQYVEVLSSMDKRRRLEEILRSKEPGSKIIIFCATKKMCNQLAGNLNHRFGAAAIHGDKSQSDRDSILSQFRTGKSPVLVATDVAARGLDIKDIRVVINFDFPTGIEDYVHRIGRTGRAGATGEAYTFFSDQDGRYASDLIKILEGADQRVPDELREIASRGGGGGMGRGRRWSSSSGGYGGSYDSGYGGGDGGYGGSYSSGNGGRDGGYGGNYSSGNGGRDGGYGGSYSSGNGGQGAGSGGWSASFSSEKGGGNGYNNDSSDRDQYGHNSGDGVGSGSSQAPLSFHERMMMQASAKPRRSPSRSPNRDSGWGGGNSGGRSRSRSVERFDRASAAASEAPVGSGNSPNGGQKGWESSPKEPNDEPSADWSCLNSGKEEVKISDEDYFSRSVNPSPTHP